MLNYLPISGCRNGHSFTLIIVMLSLLVSGCLKMSSEQVNDSSIKWDKGVFTVNIVCLVGIKAIWSIPRDDKPGEPVGLSDPSLDADGVIETFDKQLQQRKDRGIFIYSRTYAIPDTPEERQESTEYLYKLYQNPEWRKSEGDLIEGLRVKCKQKGIPLFVNLSANLHGKWKKL